MTHKSTCLCFTCSNAKRRASSKRTPKPKQYEYKNLDMSKIDQYSEQRIRALWSMGGGV